MGRTYCVVECKSGKQVPRHKFPKESVRCHEWIKNLNLNFLENICANDLQKYRVCYKHFREEDYSCSPHNRFLCSTAIPVIDISNYDNVITINNMQHTQKPLQHVPKENDEHNKMCSPVLTEISHIPEQMQP